MHGWHSSLVQKPCSLAESSQHQISENSELVKYIIIVRTLKSDHVPHPSLFSTIRKEKIKLMN